MQPKALASLPTAATLADSLDGSYPASSINLVSSAIRDGALLTHADRILGIKGDEDNPLWELLAIRDIVLRDGSDDDMHGPLVKHPLVTQLLWNKRKLTAQHHPACPVIISLRERRNAFVSRYVMYGFDLGEDSTLGLDLKHFMLPDVFFKHFWNGDLHLIHWWNDFVLPIENALDRVGSTAPDPSEAHSLSLARMPLFKKYLLRLAALLSVPADGEFSLHSMVETCKDLLQQAQRMGRGSVVQANMNKNAESIFARTMQAAGPYITSRLRSDDPSLQLRQQFIPATALEVRDFIATCYDATHSFGSLSAIVPDFLPALMQSTGPGLVQVGSMPATAANMAAPGGQPPTHTLCYHTR